MNGKENKVAELMEKVAEMLGVELNEEFNIIGDSKPLYYSPYKITERGLIDKDNIIRDDRLGDLFRGIYKVQKLPWKPKMVMNIIMHHYGINLKLN
ncbi:MAG TPA: hypothetical protein DCM01_07535 [Dielma fastidiosa]|jgi:hypothetical protein|nr:hypothetical protein [Dielma fastidiosa]